MKISIKILIILTLIFSSSQISLASETNGTITAGGNSGFAWSNQAGWVNFGTTNGNVQITDSGITGYAWNDNHGWINLAPTNGGISVAASGALSGYAWSSGLGWINFSGVSINSSSKFVGQATGTGIGTLTFDCANCSVITDYRPANFRTTSGGGSSGGYLKPKTIPTVLTTPIVPQTPETPAPLALPSFDSVITPEARPQGLEPELEIFTTPKILPEVLSEILPEVLEDKEPLFDVEVGPAGAQVLESEAAEGKILTRKKIIFPLILILGLLLVLVYRKIHARRF